MSPSVVRSSLDVSKPPAAIAGSPGTAIVSVKSSESSAAAAAFPVADPPLGSQQHSSRDYIPPLWSFETPYSILGSMIGTPRAVSQNGEHAQQQHKKDHHKDSNIHVFHGNWFGRKKEKEKEKEAEHSRSERSRSVDPPSRTLHPVASTHSASSSSSKGTLTPKPSSNLRAISHSSSRHIKTDPGPPLHSNASYLEDSPVKNNFHHGNGHTHHPHESTPRSARSRHPPSSFHPTNGHHAEPDKKKRSNTAPSATGPEHSHTQESFLGGAFNIYGMPEGHAAMHATVMPFAPVHHGVSKNVAHRKETPVESFKRRIKEAHSRGFTIKNAKRYHSIPRDEAPYTRDYEHKTLDFDEWTRLFEFHLVKKCCFFPFTTEPKRVLDLGCGTGSWVVQCAQEWKDTTFVGLDLVSIQPNLKHLGDPSLALRVEWVTANFLKPLPFKDGEFDFVHVRRIARGVPENQWEALLDEITRVLMTGGAFEMVEEDLFFPGSVSCESKCDSSDEDSVSLGETTNVESEKEAQAFALARDTSPRVKGDVPIQFWEGEGDDRDAKSRQVQQMTISALSERQKSRLSVDERPPGRKGTVGGNPNGTEDSLFHPLINPILNPRDHSILEAAYNELHASRFINLLPLSLLSSMLVYHFKDVCTHEQTELLFPKRSQKKTGQKKRSVSLHAPIAPFAASADPTKPTATRRKSYHSRIAESPGANSDQPSPHPPEPFFRPINMITDGVLRLPNDKWRFDERMLSMHLAIHVNEVLACAEEMWEFIQTCQKNPRRWKNTPMAGLSELVREEWDDCLVRFQLDMQDKIALADLLRLQFPLGILPSPKKSDRKLFDEAVERWETHRRQLDIEEGKKPKRPKRRRPISRSLRIFIARKE